MSVGKGDRVRVRSLAERGTPRDGERVWIERKQLKLYGHIPNFYGIFEFNPINHDEKIHHFGIWYVAPFNEFTFLQKKHIYNSPRSSTLHRNHS